MGDEEDEDAPSGDIEGRHLCNQCAAAIDMFEAGA